MSDIKNIVAAALLACFVGSPASAGDLGDKLGDPTRPSRLRAQPSAPAVERGPSWHVESIIVSPGRRLAVINDRVVGVDDRVDGATVVEILPYEVRLEYQGEIRRVSLVSTRVKRPASR